MQTPNHSLAAIFEAISSHKEITRREISALTGFSQVTVGKTVDALSDAGIIHRRKNNGDGVGRKGDICSLNKNHGMILFDVSEEKIRMVICDIGLNILFEAFSDDLSELVMAGLPKTVELGFESVPRIGCICKRGESEKITKSFEDLLGSTPDVVCYRSHANAYANHRRFGYGDEIFARIFPDGDGWAAIMKDGQIHKGSHGNAGIFSRGEQVSEFVRHICQIGEALDTALIHISCGEVMCSEVSSVMTGFFSEADVKPELLAEAFSNCPDIILGLADKVRSNFLVGLLSK